MGFLKGKRALIVGVASKRSIAWGIAEAMHRQGAELAFTYQTDKLRSRVEQVAEACESDIIIPCDVAYDDQIEETYNQLSRHWDGYDILVHSVGFAPREQLVGNYLDAVTREGFRIAHDISSYSFAALAKAGRLNIYTSYLEEMPLPLDANVMHRNESLLTGSEGRTELDFHQAVKLIAHGNVDVKPLISQVVDYENISEGIEAAMRPDTLRVLLAQ